MIQRIQSIYLLITALIAGAVSFFVEVYKNFEIHDLFPKDELVVMGLFIVSAVLSLCTIFLFKNRKLQFVLNRLNIILNLILLGLFVYWSLNAPGEAEASKKGVGMILPFISIVFLVLANRAIKKDEDLVKSVDRLR